MHYTKERRIKNEGEDEDLRYWALNYSQIMHINNNNLFNDIWFTNILTL